MEFTEKVEQLLMNEDEPVKELWRFVVAQFEREGPEAAEGYLDTQRQQHEERIRRLLNEFEDG